MMYITKSILLRRIQNTWNLLSKVGNFPQISLSHNQPFSQEWLFSLDFTRFLPLYIMVLLYINKAEMLRRILKNENRCQKPKYSRKLAFFLQKRLFSLNFIENVNFLQNRQGEFDF